MTAQEIAEQLKQQFLQGRGTVTQLPGKASPEVAKYYDYHKGYDIGVESGTPIIAPSNMKILGSGSQGGYGNRLVAYDPAKNETYYFSHLSGIADKTAKEILAGQVLGYTGGTPGTAGAGNTTGAHLDIEMVPGLQSPSFSNTLLSALNKGSTGNGSYQQNLLADAKKKYGNGVIGLTNDPNKVSEYQKKGYKVVRL